jgi:hypothetical protein
MNTHSDLSIYLENEPEHCLLLTTSPIPEKGAAPKITLSSLFLRF